MTDLKVLAANRFDCNILLFSQISPAKKLSFQTVNLFKAHDLQLFEWVGSFEGDLQAQTNSFHPHIHVAPLLTNGCGCLWQILLWSTEEALYVALVIAMPPKFPNPIAVIVVNWFTFDSFTKTHILHSVLMHKKTTTFKLIKFLGLYYIINFIIISYMHFQQRFYPMNHKNSDFFVVVASTSPHWVVSQGARLTSSGDKWKLLPKRNHFWSEAFPCDFVFVVKWKQLKTARIAQK